MNNNINVKHAKNFVNVRKILTNIYNASVTIVYFILLFKMEKPILGKFILLTISFILGNCALILIYKITTWILDQIYLLFTKKKLFKTILVFNDQEITYLYDPNIKNNFLLKVTLIDCAVNNIIPTNEVTDSDSYYISLNYEFEPISICTFSQFLPSHALEAFVALFLLSITTTYEHHGISFNLTIYKNNHIIYQNGIEHFKKLWRENTNINECIQIAINNAIDNIIYHSKYSEEFKELVNI